MMQWLQRLMWGRYGTDQLNLTLLIVSLIVSVCSSLFRFWPLQLLSTLMLCYVLFRTFSRNIYKRQAENQKFLVFKNRVTGFFRRQKTKAVQHKDYRFLRCPTCKQNLRLPKGKGRIQITCPKCQTKFQGRT